MNGKKTKKNKEVIGKGRRIQVRDRSLLIRWGIFVASPLIALLTLVQIFITFPAIQAENVGVGNFILPIILSISLIIPSIVIPIVVIKRSIEKSGFFFKLWKYYRLAKYLYDNDYVIRKKNTGQGNPERIKFPPVYYFQGRDVDYFRFETGNKFHERFQGIGAELEGVFLADLISIDHQRGYIIYKLLVDSETKRLNFEKTSIKDGKIEFMKGVVWDFENMPHMLITGGTNGGKTYFVYTLIRLLSKVGRVHLSDPKNSDLTYLNNFVAFKGAVAVTEDEILARVVDAVELMEKRYQYMNEHPDRKMGQNYRYYGMKPEFFIFEEWGALVSVLSTHENNQLYKGIAPLVLKARQAGVFLVIVTQRAGADVLRPMVRDNLMCKVSLGILSDYGYDMTFGEASKRKKFINKYGKLGRGYIDVGEGVPIEFYSPIVDNGYDFEDYFSSMPEMEYTDVSHIKLPTKDLSPQEYYTRERGVF